MPDFRKLTAVLLPCGLALSACASMDATGPRDIGRATLSFADGRSAGTAIVLEDGNALQLRVTAAGLPAGPHGFHLHTTGKCEAPGFTSAGGHLNPDARKHGSLAEGGAHLGDLPNLEANASGSAMATLDIAGGLAARASIFDADGTAVVIHANPDDYRTDPTGGAGDRIACGVIRRVE